MERPEITIIPESNEPVGYQRGPCGSAADAIPRGPTRLIVLRGNSGSGKSSIAAAIRARYGRGIALVGQDNLRRVVLRERDTARGVNIGLIDLVARYALDHGFQVIIDGIL